MRALVVDDEGPARRRLVRMLGQIEGVEVVGEADGGEAALSMLEGARPDLLFLDIHMPGVDGLELAASYAGLPPVVFVTAYDEHAVRAFELNAVDYLLKPVHQGRLASAVRRAEGRLRPAAESFRALPKQKGALPPRVVTHERGTISLFDASGIDRFYSADKYTAFIIGGKEHITEEPLSALEGRLRDHGFLRVHRGELVRTAAVRALTHEAGVYEARLADGQVARVSRRLVAALKEELGILPKAARRARRR